MQELSYWRHICLPTAAQMWQAVETMCCLFFETSKWVAEKSHFEFNQNEADSCRFYLRKVKEIHEF